MIKKEVIEEVKKRLVRVYDPLEIYIFGSYAWGSPTEDSDLDLCIVVNEIKGKKHDMLVDGHHVLFGLKIPKDIIIYSKEEFEKYSKNVTTLLHKIKEEGELIYARA